MSPARNQVESSDALDPLLLVKLLEPEPMLMVQVTANGNQTDSAESEELGRKRLAWHLLLGERLALAVGLSPFRDGSVHLAPSVGRALARAQGLGPFCAGGLPPAARRANPHGLAEGDKCAHIIGFLSLTAAISRVFRFC